VAGQLSTAATGIASHTQCCGNWATYLMPFGTKIRLKPTFNSSGYPASCAPLLTQMKTYGLIYSDGGGNDIVPQFSSVWPTDCASYMYMNFAFNPANFDVVQQANTNIVCMAGGTNCPNTLPVGSPPAITGFTATPASVTLGQSVALHWSVSGVVDVDGNSIPMRNISFGKNNKLGPGWIDGPAHGESLLITPYEPGTYVYQLMVQNRFGRTTAKVTVTVTK